MGRAEGAGRDPVGAGHRRSPSRRPSGLSSPRRHSAALPGTEPGPGLARRRGPFVYVNRFGSHRCGTVLRYGWGAGGSESSPGMGAPSPESDGRGLSPVLEAPCPAGIARGRRRAARSHGSPQPAGWHHGDHREDKADTFDFPCPSRNVDKAAKRKKQKSKVWLRVRKVISKMLEENEKFRSRLKACSQCSGEVCDQEWMSLEEVEEERGEVQNYSSLGSDMNRSSENEASYLDKEESIFGWV